MGMVRKQPPTQDQLDKLQQQSTDLMQMEALAALAAQVAELMSKVDGGDN